MLECPTCHRPFGGAHAFCFACRRPILRNHKRHFEGCYIVHDDCANPTMRVLFKGAIEAVPAQLIPPSLPQGGLAAQPQLAAPQVPEVTDATA